MRLTLIRHAQSFNNALKDHTQRLKDPHLTDLGLKQADMLAEHLAESGDGYDGQVQSYNIDAIYCSAMHRAMQTTRPVAAALGLKPRIWVDLHEIGGIFLEEEPGIYRGYPGMTRKEIAAEFPDYVLSDDITDMGWWRPEDGLEIETAAQYRALKVAAALRDRAGEDEHIAIVSHAGFLDRVIKAMLNQLPDVPRTVFHAHYNTGFSRMDFGNRDRLRFLYMNRVDHLPPELRSW